MIIEPTTSFNRLAMKYYAKLCQLLLSADSTFGSRSRFTSVSPEGGWDRLDLRFEIIGDKDDSVISYLCTNISLR